MTRGHVYMIMMAFFIPYFVLAEVLYRRALSKYEKGEKWGKSVSDKYNYYERAFLIVLGIYTAVGVIIGMINTWNDPI